jgi:hypothetical protein
MLFNPDSMLSITQITRAFRIYDYELEAWIKEGRFPAYEWRNGRRYWDSNKVNAFALGCNVHKASNSRKKTVSTKTEVLPYACAVVALILINALG